MKSKTFFGGFDFDTVWEIYPDSSYPYPQLRSNRLDVTAGAESIEISQLPTKLSYLEGKDELNLAGGRVTVTYNDGSTREIAMTNDMVTGFDNTKVGTQTLTVTLGRFTATFDVTVVAKSLSGISVSQLPTKTEYIEGLEAFDAAGGKLSLLYNNDTSEEVDLSVAQITGFDNTKVGLQTLTARFNGFTTTFQIEIIAKSVASIEVYKLPEKLTYLEAKDTLDVTGGKVKVIYNNGTNDVIDMTADMISGFNNTRVGPLTLTVTYSGKTATFDVEIIAKSIASISMSALPAKLNYIEGLEELNVAGGKVKLNYNNGTSAVVDLTDDMVAGFDNSTVGKCKVDVYYEGCETSFEVNIIAKSVSSIEMARYPDKLVYLEAKDALDVAGGWIRVYCNNNTEEEIELTSSMVSGFSNTKIGTQNLTVTYQGKKTSYEIEVIAKSLIGIEIANLPAKLTYLEGKDQLSVTGGRIKLLYDNDTENVISITAAMVTGFDNTVVGKQTLTINYEGFAAEYEIEIIAKSVSSIYFDTKPSKTSFVESRETLDVSGGKLHVNYNNGTYGIVEVTPDMVDGFDNTKIGRQTLTVSYGGKSITYSIEVVHDYVPTVVDPKCTESGYTLYTCAACGDFYKANYTSPLGHSFTNYVSNNDATCTEDGTKTAKCDRCDVTDTVSDAGSKLGHNYKAKVTAPTCTEKGFTTYTCSRCNDTYTSDEKNALGHSFTNYVSNNDATCTKDGTKTAKCDRCDATDTKKDKNSAKGHTPGNWEIIKYSTQTEKGVRVKKCTVCGAELEREETEPIVNPFKDLPEGKWYTDAALWCYARGLISGTGADAFSPNSTLSRAMFVQILAKADGVDLSKYEYSGRFADVKANNWYAKAVEWAVSCGVTNGTGANAFSPNNAVTREQLATFFLAYAKYKGYDVSAKTDLTAYADHAKISKWAETAISWAVAEKLISGTGNNMLSPKGTATRAQAAVIFKNFIEVYKAKQ